MTSGSTETWTGARAPAPRAPAARRLPREPVVQTTTAIVLATARGEGDGPAGGLRFEDGTVVGRLLDQLADLGVGAAHVVTRPGWESALSIDARVHTSWSAADDLRLVAELARAAPGAVVLACGDVVAHREALAGLLADSRVGTAVLAGSGAQGGPFAFRVRSFRGRLVGASSPYHSVHRPNLAFLGVLKVAPADRGALVAAAERLVPLVTTLPATWRKELGAKAQVWGEALADEAELARRAEAAPQDVTSLLLVGLVRAGVDVGISHLRRLFWARPLSSAEVERAGERLGEYDEDRVLLESAVKANDGFFTTFFVSPYSKYIARWAARRGLTPNAVTIVSMGIGILAAVAFATGERAGLIAGAVLLQVSFTTDCVDGQLARYTRTFSKLGAWLDSIFDRAKEYAVFAGLAIGASHAGDPVWVLAGAALTLQTLRHMSDFSFADSRPQAFGATRQSPVEQSADAPRAEPVQAVRRPGRALAAWAVLDDHPVGKWVKKVVAFPIGERFAVISLTAAVASARTTFVVLLVWGGVAACYTNAGRLLRSVSG